MFNVKSFTILLSSSRRASPIPCAIVADTDTYFSTEEDNNIDACPRSVGAQHSDRKYSTVGSFKEVTSNLAFSSISIEDPPYLPDKLLKGCQYLGNICGAERYYYKMTDD